MTSPVIPNPGFEEITTLYGDEFFSIISGSQDIKQVTAANVARYVGGGTGSGATGATGATGETGGTGATGAGGGGGVTIIPITTGASPLTINPDPAISGTIIYEITTGGTAGNEVIYFNAYGGGVVVNPTGQQVSFTIVTKINASDVVSIGSGDADNVGGSHPRPFFLEDNLGREISDNINFLVLNALSQIVVVVWYSDYWNFDNGLSDSNNATVISAPIQYVPPVGTDGQIVAQVAGVPEWVDPPIFSNTALVSGSSAKSQLLTVDFTASFGAISALTGTAVTQTITGLLTTDQVHVECISSPPSGYLPPNARVSASDTLSLFFNTAVALGITLGSLNFRVTVIR